jgi:murein DD-endopeptidase MepM/ murein hydrolase activator NlpD
MAKDSVARRGFGAAGSVVLLAVLLAACEPRVGGPAPVISGEESPWAPPAQVIVQRGQTLSGIAETYHVPMRVLAEANHLSPPYRIVVGHGLIIPGGGEPAPFGGPASRPAAIAALPPPSPEIAPRPPLSEADEGRPIPLDRPPPASAARPSAVAAPPLALTPPASAPLAPRTAETLSPPPSATPPAAPSAPAALPAPPPPAAPNSSASAEPPPAHGGGTFLWPVRGHILESYGTGPDGTHNDGINIAAPRGAAVQATDAGVVAYAGNELRGYGNLILIKHANGWISAYAHCDLMLVKAGQKVARGQVIARVGSTGNVGEPQLHFELRRGKHAVDPREYLAPLPTAATQGSRAG